MTTQQPDALRLAAMLTADEWPGSVTLVSYARECVAELLRQHARIAELEAVGAGGVQALSAAPAEQEEAAQRLRKTLDIDPGDVNDPLHPRYIAGFKSGHAAGRRRAAPAASPTPPVEQQAAKAAPGEPSADSLRHQNKLLAETLGACILASGIVRKDIDGFTGPELLHFGEDLRSMLKAAPQQGATKAAPGELKDHQILAITTAYEQAVGKGHQAYKSGKEIANPYDSAYGCDLAWQYGYGEGKEQAQRGVKPDRQCLALYTAPQPSPTAQSADSVQEDAARWRMAALIGKELMLRPDKRTHATAVKAYMDATHSGSDLTGAVDAALAAQGDKDA